MLQYKSFNLRDADRYLCSAELTIMLELENSYYFNRLIVPPAKRNKGIASNLLLKVGFWADENNITIYCDVNPYGDLNRKQLMNLYRKYGFIGKNPMIRHPKIKGK
jgi:GNAT superfamily N-acetyltransferase